MTLLQILAALLAAAGVALLFAGTVVLLRRRTVEERILAFVSTAGIEARERTRRRVRERDPRPAPAERLLKRLLKRLSRSSLGAAVQARLHRAGLSLRPSEYILLHAAVVLAGAVIGGLFVGHGRTAPLMALAGGLAGAVAPPLVLRLLERQRLATFEKQLPQAIDSMAASLRAGSTLAQATDAIASEMPAPIAVEFRRALRDMELGLSFVDSLAKICERVPSADLQLLCSAVSIHHRVGGDLSPVLAGLSHTIRERLRIRSEVTVLTAQSRYSAYVVTLLPVAIFAFLWFTNYDYLANLFLPGITRLLLVGAMLSTALGYLAMKKVAAVEV